VPFVASDSEFREWNSFKIYKNKIQIQKHITRELTHIYLENVCLNFLSSEASAEQRPD